MFEKRYRNYDSFRILTNNGLGDDQIFLIHRETFVRFSVVFDCHSLFYFCDDRLFVWMKDHDEIREYAMDGKLLRVISIIIPHGRRIKEFFIVRNASGKLVIVYLLLNHNSNKGDILALCEEEEFRFSSLPFILLDYVVSMVFDSNVLFVFHSSTCSANTVKTNLDTISLFGLLHYNS
jgi:hypothetical protein